MRFTTFAASVALLFGSAAWAAPAASPAALVERSDQISTTSARGIIPEGDIVARAAADVEILEARKAKWEKIDVKNEAGKNGNKGGKIPQNEWDDVKEMAQKALYQADCTEGSVTHRFHTDGSQDDKEHFTVKPTDGDGEKNGEIHVYRDGSWTQGAGGNANHGDGQV